MLAGRPRRPGAAVMSLLARGGMDAQLQGVALRLVGQLIFAASGTGRLVVARLPRRLRCEGPHFSLLLNEGRHDSHTWLGTFPRVSDCGPVGRRRGSVGRSAMEVLDGIAVWLDGACAGECGRRSASARIVDGGRSRRGTTARAGVATLSNLTRRCGQSGGSTAKQRRCGSVVRSVPDR